MNHDRRDELSRAPAAGLDQRLAGAAAYGDSELVRHVDAALVASRLFDEPPPTIGRFEVVRRVGEGGMGVVFEARDPSLDRRVAIKVLLGTSDPRRARSIEHEARALARFAHPNVVSVFELGSSSPVGEQPGELYVCMEYVDGGNLADWLTRNPDPAPRALLTIFLGAARGLWAVHSAGMVHRDFKPHNLLVSSEGIPRVTDFGLSTSERSDAVSGQASDEQGRDEPSLGLSRVTSYVGTPGYMAPEVEAGEPATAKSDQFSFFVTLERAGAQLSTPLPAVVVDAIARGKQADPSRRFADMQAVVELLERVVHESLGEASRAREVLCERVDKLWIAPLRAMMLDAGVRELPVELEPAPEYLARDRPAPRLAATTEGIASAMRSLRSSVVLVGAAGSGKSVQLRAIAEALLAGARAREDAHMPVILNLSSFASFRGSFEDWLENELVAKIALQRRQVQRWLADGRIALLLDGLDEVAANQRKRCVEGIDQLRARGALPYLVTCREESYAGLAPRLGCDVVFRVRPLASEQVRDFLISHPAFGRARLDAILTRDPELVEQLRTPLLLSLFVRLADEFEGLGDDLEAPLRERLYRAALDHSLHHPAIAEPSERRRREAGLRWLAAAMTRAGASELWLESLQTAWLASPSQRWLARGLGLTVIFALSFAINLAANQITAQPRSTGLFFGFIAAAAAIFINGGLRVVPMEAMRWSWPRFVRWIPYNLGLGVVMGAVYGLFHDFWADLVLGIATGIIGLSVIGLEPSARERRVEPNEGMEESIRNSLVVAPIIGVVIGVPIGYVVLPLVRPLASPDSMYFTHPEPELAWAVTMGTSAMVTSLFITGMLAAVMHWAVRVTLAVTSPLPLKLQPWLDEWVERDMLTRIGGGWAFRHETLRQWLGKPG